MNAREIIAKLKALKLVSTHRHFDCELCRFEKEGFLMGIDKAIEVLQEEALKE